MRTACDVETRLDQRAFAGDRNIIGRQITADAMNVTVVGVMPKGFDFPGDGAEAWIPAGWDPADFNRGNHFISVVGRLKPGVSVERARGANVPHPQPRESPDRPP